MHILSVNIMTPTFFKECLLPGPEAMRLQVRFLLGKKCRMSVARGKPYSFN